MTTEVDDRTEEQRKTHTLAVVARDNFMSGSEPCHVGRGIY